MAGHVDWREWGDEFVVRTGDSGATYLLSALAGEMLKALCDRALSMEELCARVLYDSAPPSTAAGASVSTFADPGEDAKSLLAVLQELEALGLARAELA